MPGIPFYNAQQVAGGAGYLATLAYEKRLRDFRVTTIFEGTTEIHSIYPALFLLRSLIREMKTLSGGWIGQIIFLIKGIFSRGRWDIGYENRIMGKLSTHPKRRSLHHKIFQRIIEQ